MPILEDNEDGEHHYMLLSIVRASSESVLLPRSQSWDGIPSLCAPYACKLVGNANSLCIKRLKSIEKRVRHPLLDICFITSNHELRGEHNYHPQYDIGPDLRYQTGHYDLLQLTSRIEEESVEGGKQRHDLNEACSRFYQQLGAHGSEKTVRRKFRGYFFLAYKTMEHMSTMKFAKGWKTWSGARYICTSLPQPYYFRRLSFFRQSGSSAEFTYIMLIQIEHLMVSAETALNLASSLRQRLSAYVGVYREIDFTVDQCSGEQLQLNSSPIRLPSRPSIFVDLRRPVLANVQCLQRPSINDTANDEAIVNEFNETHRIPFHQPTDRLYEAKMVHSWNSYADDLLINLVEAEGTSEREHESTLSFKALYEQNMVPSPTPTQNNPASSSSDESSVISNVEPIEVTPDGHTIVRRANGYAQSAHGAFHDIRADNDSNTMIVNNMIGHVRRANAHTPRYGTFGNSLLQAPFASFPLPPDGGMKLGDRTMRRHHTSQSSFASKWKLPNEHSRSAHEMVFDNPYTLYASPVNESDQSYHSPHFSINDSSKTKVKQRPTKQLPIDIASDKDSWSIQRMHNGRRKCARAKQVRVEIENVTDEENDYEADKSVFHSSSMNCVNGRSRTGMGERGLKLVSDEHSPTSPTSIPLSQPIPVLLSKDDRVGKTIHPVRQLISKLKPLRLTSNDGSQIGPKDDSRFNEAAAKNSGMHLLRKSSELKEESCKKAIPLEDVEYIMRKKRSWSMRASKDYSKRRSRRKRHS